MNIFNKKPFLIAEIGLNYQDIAEKEGMSDIDAAKLMVRKAKESGVDAVNFYGFKFENLVSQDYVGDEIRSLTFDELEEIAEYCSELGILFLATPFDFESADFLDKLCDIYIVSSPDLTNIPFIKHIAAKNKSIILMTGGATLREISQAVNVIEEYAVDLALMHSVLAYHSYFGDANLLMIRDLIAHFPDYEIGYSDYIETDEDMLILSTAFNYGAVILNKPFTLDKTLPGNAHFCSMDEMDVAKFRKNLQFISKINGYSNKQPLVCESSARRELRKSIVAKTDIRKGDEISEENISFKRPGLGISPGDWESVIGKIAVCNIKKDSQITFDKLN